MKTLITIILVVGFVGFQANAQTANKETNYPYWTISKEINKIQFKDVKYVPAKITLTSPMAAMSKGSAQMMVRKETGAERAVSTSGYPTWTISKAAARMQVEKGRQK